MTLNIVRKCANMPKNSFKHLANTWWKMSNNDPLYLMNQVRVPFVRDGLNASDLRKHCKIDKSAPLEGLNLLDIGCGVGFLSQPLARLGAQITGIDPEPENIHNADIEKLKDSRVCKRVEFICGYSDQLLPASYEKFDGVIASEVIEHVENQESFVQSAVNLTKKEGSLFFTTINRTRISYVTAIVLAEKILGIVPSGIHEWKKFVTPKELTGFLEASGCEIRAIHGIKYNPLTKKFHWCKDTSDNYALHAIKR